ncbi:MAG: hypothetical protein KKF56_03125 [Nanoarchaeota archaeon]|nr:hypothetical protein [Nanoarchaeota archaeon]
MGDKQLIDVERQSFLAGRGPHHFKEGYNIAFYNLGLDLTDITKQLEDVRGVVVELNRELRSDMAKGEIDLPARLDRFTNSRRRLDILYSRFQQIYEVVGDELSDLETVERYRERIQGRLNDLPKVEEIQDGR